MTENDIEPDTPEMIEAMHTKQVRMRGILEVLWKAHPDTKPQTFAEGIGQANALYAELYPGKSSTTP